MKGTKKTRKATCCLRLPSDYFRFTAFTDPQAIFPAVSSDAVNVLRRISPIQESIRNFCVFTCPLSSLTLASSGPRPPAASSRSRQARPWKHEPTTKSPTHQDMQRGQGECYSINTNDFDEDADHLPENIILEFLQSARKQRTAGNRRMSPFAQIGIREHSNAVAKTNAQDHGKRRASLLKPKTTTPTVSQIKSSSDSNQRSAFLILVVQYSAGEAQGAVLTRDEHVKLFFSPLS